MKRTLTIILTIFNVVMCVMILALFSSRDNPNKGINKLLSLSNISTKASETIPPKIENTADIVDTSSTVSSDTKIVVISKPSANKSSIIVNTPNPSTTPTTYDVTIEFLDATQTHNDHVGDDWINTISINGTVLELGQSKKINISEGDLEIECHAVENDDYPDKGSDYIIVSYSDLQIGNNVYETSFSVREDNGKYTGNTSGWTYTVKVSIN